MNTKRKLSIALLRGVMILCTVLTGALVLFLMGYVLAKGLPNISWELLSTKPSYLSGRIGILPDILNTLYIVLATLVIVLPLGVGAAIYLTEYIAALVEKFKAMVEAEGTLTNIDEWGKRRLAYLINDLAEGYYVLMNFESKPEFPAELERVMKITEGVMRCLTTAVEE